MVSMGCLGNYPIKFWYLKLKGIGRQADPTDVDVDRELIFLFKQAQGCKSIKIKIKFNWMFLILFNQY
jgi:hypothetical protein